MPGYGEWEFREEEQRTPHHVHYTHRYGYVSSLSVDRARPSPTDPLPPPGTASSRRRRGGETAASPSQGHGRAPRSSTARRQDYQKEVARSDEGAPDRSRNYEYVHRNEYARVENERDLLFRALQRQVATNPPAQPLPNIPGLITPEQRYALVAYILMCQEHDRVAVHDQLLREAEVARQAEPRVRRERRERSGTSYFYCGYGFSDII
ncbi:hypothetical protein BBO_08937 [Beauveria brongniartii RCEF 3172]|uniref:Uncharacterized protein n=1 Tax=Beauveria brongniartii RCEF 3172 TaxID=1081107 RepID=A0A166WQM0_9HYPO|nr:hypothetical protein BBO_08937 [Beauveria brongniartii RCEF 3172]